MVVFSEPLQALVGGGKNALYVKGCTELHLGSRSIEKLRGFEPFVNLEVLWLNNNRISYINNLDQNFRIKEIYAQNNKICTLKGSLQNFKFLELLDLSNNELRDLDKIATFLKHFQFLRNLNLMGNPCCEEADYRLTMIHALPQLNVLDQHVITPAERRKAKGLIGGDVATLTVAFGKRVPQYDPAWDEHRPERSPLEQQLGKEAADVRQARKQAENEAEQARREHNPYPEIQLSRTLPPPAGLQRALQEGQQQQSAAAGQSCCPTTQSTRSIKGSYNPRDVYIVRSISPAVETTYTSAAACLGGPERLPTESTSRVIATTFNTGSSWKISTSSIIM